MEAAKPGATKRDDPSESRPGCQFALYLRAFCGESQRMHENRERLAALANDLLSLDHPGRLREAAIGLHALCAAATGIGGDADDGNVDAGTMLPSGVALDPASAGLCTIQYPRTAAFLRGVLRAVKEAQARFPGRRIEVLYAGCGPFAPLAIPLMTRFSADEVRFTLLDIHQESLDAARLLVERYGFSAHVREYVKADAAVYRHPAEEPLHIVVTETMQRALMREPQVAVTLNLAPQLCAGGILLPERITVDACLYCPATEFSFAGGESSEPTPKGERVRVPLGKLIELDMASVPLLKNSGFSPVRVLLPAQTKPRWRLMLRTLVTVFEDIVLGEYESGITCPYVGKDLDALKPESEVEFHYELGSVPGFRAQQR